jgi:hypothetical protein
VAIIVEMALLLIACFFLRQTGRVLLYAIGWVLLATGMAWIDDYEGMDLLVRGISMSVCPIAALVATHMFHRSQRIWWIMPVVAAIANHYLVEWIIERIEP